MKRTTISLILAIACLLCGCTQPVTAAVQAEPQMQLRLKFDREPGEDASWEHFSSEDLNGNYQGDLYYQGLCDVTVELDGVHQPLEAAIRDSRITVEPLVAYAQADARNGYCIEKSETQNGLTRFEYVYSGNFSLLYINDIFETPDGQQHRIQEASILDYNVMSEFPTFLAEGGGPGDYIDKEDWGLTFAIEEVTPEGLTVRCSQSGGQQFGTLQIWSYMLYRTDSPWTYEPDSNTFTQPITMNGTTTFSIDWTKALDALSPGSYGIRLRVEDTYSPEDVPPLSRNYHDRQLYHLEFTME